MLISTGLLLLLGVGAYHAYGAYTGAQLDKLNVSIEGPAPSMPVPDGAGAWQQEPPAPAPSSPTDGTGTPEENEAQPRPGQSDPQASQTGPDVSDFPASSYASIYPGYLIHPKDWHQPLWAGTEVFAPQDRGLPEGYRPVAPADVGPAHGDRAAAVRIRIPLIDVDSPVKPLAIIERNGRREYETPKHVVGHIPGTANPGELGNGWLFGHLESPFKGEGNVFHRLPEVPQLLVNGTPVYVILDSDDGEYLYQVVSSRVVHQDDLALYDSDDATITLVTCARRPYYDHRQLVTARLVGIRE